MFPPLSVQVFYSVFDIDFLNNETVAQWCAAVSFCFLDVSMGSLVDLIPGMAPADHQGSRSQLGAGLHHLFHSGTQVGRIVTIPGKFFS